MEYQGEDLILATGAPGSRWSAGLHSISSHPDINNTDKNEERSYDKPVTLPDGRTIGLGYHRGCYWGPDHDFGHTFDNMQSMSKQDIIEEFQKPFQEWTPGIKIVKSHWFSYHLEYLHKLFPKAMIVGYYLPDDICFDWWHTVGGWNISYPHYTWYKNDEGMKKGIKTENANLIKFMSEKGGVIREFETLNDTLNELDLDGSMINYENVFATDSKIQNLFNENKKINENLDPISFTKSFLDNRCKATVTMIYNPYKEIKCKLASDKLINDTWAEIKKYGRI